MWPFNNSKKKKKDFDYTPEEQKVIDKCEQYIGVISYPNNELLKLINKLRKLEEDYYKSKSVPTRFSP